MQVTQPIDPPPKSEDEWLEDYEKTKAQFDKDHPTVAVDIVLLSVRDGRLRIPLIRRIEHPDYGAWVLPGGFLRVGERIEEAVTKVLQGKLGIKRKISTDGFGFYDLPDRDPRDRVVSLAHLGRVPISVLPAQDGRYVLHAEVQGDKLNDDLGSAIELGFDHADIVAGALNVARRAVLADPLWAVPLVKTRDNAFTVPDVAAVRKALGFDMNDDALRRKITSDPRVVAAHTKISRGTGRRPPVAYRLA